MTGILKINDAAWLYAETFRTPMHVGVLATFAMPQDAGEGYLQELVARWREVRTFSPPFNYVLRGPAPHWKVLPDTEIDLDYHFRHSALPVPGGQRALGVLVSRLHSHKMDRRYPLWECHVIEGVAPGKWSLYVKVHHSQVDGVGGVRMFRRMFSVDPAARGMLPPWAVGTRGEDQSGVPPRPAPSPAAPTTGIGGLLRPVLAASSMTSSLVRTYTEAFSGSKTPLRAVPYRAPKSVLNGRINAPRRFATQQYDLARLRAVAKAADASINDVFLALCGAALRRYLDELGELPSASLTANVPVSVRPEADPGTGPKVGTALTFLFAKLGTDIEDPATRLRAVRDSTRLGKARVPHASGSAMDAYTVMMMLPILSEAILGVGGIGPPAANVVISNVPGFTEQRYFDGSSVEEYYPLSLLFHGQALNITAVSNTASFCIGYTGSRDQVPHLQRVAVYSGEALEELESALGIGARARAAAGVG